ncbi:MAG: helix-turn-helix transcriptional regulator [Lachnospiraceae bacterium]|nr:helix-turn-helix transcriptional regulator [Lachnospiraceae bacterium]
MNINQYLKESERTVASLSKCTGIPYTTVSELVNGKVDIDRVYVGTAIKLASACQIDFHTFYDMCKESTNLSDDSKAKVIVKNKYYYLDYKIGEYSGTERLFKANLINKPFVKDAAEWEYKRIRDEIKYKKDMEELEAWKATDII